MDTILTSKTELKQEQQKSISKLRRPGCFSQDVETKLKTFQFKPTATTQVKVTSEDDMENGDEDIDIKALEK